jgi:hypothetical protein
MATACHAANPFITSIYTADPSAHVWPDGRLYVYPSHDIDPAVGSDLMDRYHVFSTSDMVNWRDEGEILRASDVPWGRPEGGFMWAPDCATRDGTYYLFFPHPSGTDWNSTWKIGVATSSRPAGGFTNVGYITNVGGFSMIDPCVFIDADGQAYFYYGGGGQCQGTKLKPNMVELDGALTNMTGLEDFHEAAWVFKHDGIYYLTYADNFPGSNRLHYATSTNALGPWTHKGVYLQPTGCDTSHGSVVEYKGQWYAFYQTKSISGQNNLRSICVDRLYFNPNGDIIPVIQTTNGVPSVGTAPPPNPGTLKHEAEDGVVAGGATVASDSAASGGRCVQNLHISGSYVQFNSINGGSKGGLFSLAIRHAAADRGKLRLTVNGADYSFLNTLPTGGWGVFTGETTFTIPLGPGATNVIQLAGGNFGVNMDYVTFAGLTVAPRVLNDDGFGVKTNRFGFNVTGNNWAAVVDACTNLAGPVWTPLATNVLTGDPWYFGDAGWTNHPTRFYRLR